jgi:hypothetical protein
MRLGTEQVGLRGLLLLAGAGVAGLVLAIHGSGHGLVAVSSNSFTQPTSSAPGGAARVPAHHPTSTTSHPSSGAAHQKLGPPLSSTQYASYAYRLYPGQPSPQARLATAGFHIEVTPGPSTIKVTVSGAGVTNGSQTLTYPANDRVYFIEASFGDDSSNAEYNLGDDGLVVTDASGRIVE